MAGGVKWNLTADSRGAVQGTKNAAQGFADLDKQQQKSVATGNEVAKSQEGVAKALDAARVVADLGVKAWEMYETSQKKMAAAVIELARGFGGLSPTAKGFVQTTDALEKRFGPLEQGISDTNDALAGTAEGAPQAAEAIEDADQAATDGRITFIAFAQAIALTETAFRAARAVYDVAATQLGKIQERVDIADDVAKTSKAFGVNAQSLQAWRSAGELAGVEASVLDRGFLNIQKSAFDATRELSTAVDLFDMAGVSATDMAGNMRPAEDIIREISQRMADGLIPATTQAALSSNLLRDRTGRFLNVLREGPEVIDANAERLRSYGALISDELLVASEEYNDSTQRLQESQTGLKNVIALGTLPALAAFKNTIAGAAEEGGVFRDRLSEILDRGGLIVAGVTFTAEALAKIPPMVARVVASSTASILGFFDTLLESAKQTIQTARGVAETFNQDAMVARLNAAATSIDKVIARFGVAKITAAGLVQDVGAGATGISEGITGFADTFLDEYEAILEKMKAGLGEAAGGGENGAGLPGGGKDGAGGGDGGGGTGEIIIPLSHATEIVMDYTEFIEMKWGEIVGHMGKAVGAFNTLIGQETTFFKVLGSIVQKLMAFRAIIETIKSIGAAFGQLASLGGGGFNPAAMLGLAGVGDRGLMPMVVADQGATAMPGMGSHSLVMRRNDEMVMDPTGTSTVTRMLKWFENNVSSSNQSLRLGGGGGGGGFTVVDDRPIVIDGHEVFRLFEERSFDANRGGRGVMADGAYEVAR